MEKIIEFSTCSGYGGSTFALSKANIDHDLIGFSEINKYAIDCFIQNHGNKINYGDITKIDPGLLPYFNLLTAGFPCQSFSNAGKGLGELDTRGTIFNDIVRIAAAKKPKYMLLENVRGLTSKKHVNTFNKILSELDKIGYNIKWKILNAKDYGIPQNRERVWIVCYRKDLGYEFDNFKFPIKEKLQLSLKDILEKNVDEKYYLTKEQIEKFIFNSNHSNSRVYNIEGISPTLNTCQGGHRQPFILIKNATKKGFLEGFVGDGINLEHPDSKTRRGRIQKDVIGCLQCNDLRGVITNDLRIRKLTPTEFFRLMGFLKDEIKLEGISNSQRYKLAGNGWVITQAAKIFEEMFKNGKATK